VLKNASRLVPTPTQRITEMIVEILLTTLKEQKDKTPSNCPRGPQTKGGEILKRGVPRPLGGK